jgi:hypothetical protein
MNLTCPECGFIHPPVAKGQCPVKANENLKESEQGEEIINFLASLKDILLKSDNYKDIMLKIKSIIKL